jgi:hypothetical protein
MVQASRAKVAWDSKKKRWVVTIEIGAESIKRWSAGNGPEAGDDALLDMAIKTARDEGYDLEPQKVSIER